MMFMKFKLTAATTTVLMMLGLLSTSPGAQEIAKGSRSVWDGVYTKDQAKRGETLYAQHCSSCHGPDLSGNDEAAPLTGANFLSNWDGLTVGDLSERVRISMPPNKLGKLSRQEIVDILSYVLGVNSFPAGKSELDSKLELQKQVRIDATKSKTN
jgi:mono/diheme cytochrome c family protein